MNDLGRNIFEIAALFIGVAVITLLLNKQSQTVPVIKAATEGFNSLLRTVTLQDRGF